MKAIVFALIPLFFIAGFAYLTEPRGGHLAGLGFMMLMCMAVVFEAFVLFAISTIVRGWRIDPALSEEARLAKRAVNVEKGKAILLAAGIVLLVGGSLCFGGSALY